MSKAEGKRWKNRQKMTDAVVQDYRRLMSANKLQKFYKNEMKATVMEGDSALKKHANTIEITNIKSKDVKGLYKIHLMENMLMDSLKHIGNLKLQLDVSFEVEDTGKIFDFPMRTRQYEVTSKEIMEEI